jgi:hypothetical protein
MWFEGKWMQLEDIMLSEASQTLKDKGHMFSLICEDKHNTNKQYYEKQVTLRGGH